MSSARWSRKSCLKPPAKNRAVRPPAIKGLRAPAEKKGAVPRTLLGIDPGSLFCGYGIVRASGSDCTYIASGRLVLSSGSPLWTRLKELYEGLTDIIREFRPTHAVVERIFFAKGAASALSLGHARGVALLAAASGGLPLCEYTALEVKKAVTGYGRAEKRQVQEMVKRILNIKNITLSPDGADALALALCHSQRMNFKEALEKRGCEPQRFRGCAPGKRGIR